jgi:hypothetical protein
MYTGMRSHSSVNDDGHAVDANKRVYSRECQRGMRNAWRESLTLDHRAAVDRVRVALHAASDGDGRAARADGDVQAAEHNADERPEQALRRRVQLARVLHVLAALRRARRGPGGGDSANKGEGRDERLREHGCKGGREGREGRGRGVCWLWEFESEERVNECLDILYPSSACVRHERA